MAALANATLIRLLDVEPELASRLREDDRAEARQQLLVRAQALPTGADASALGDARDHPFGLIVVDGVLLQDVHLAGRSSVQLLGRGDLLMPRQAASDLGGALRWTAAMQTTLAVLDDRVQAPLALWPGLAIGLMERAAQQLVRAAAHAAVLQLPRVEDRLEATFWDLADRWGRVTPSGIHLPLKLTHDVLARLVGGARPTISLALAALTDRSVVIRRPDGSWLLVADRPPALVPEPDAVPLSAALVPTTPEAPPSIQHDPWLPDARAELLATAQRIGLEHVTAAERVNAGRARFAATRAWSRTLREQAALDRDARRATRAADPAAVSPRRPGAPSAG